MEALTPLAEAEETWRTLSKVERARYLLNASEERVTLQTLMGWLGVEFESLPDSEKVEFNMLLSSARDGEIEGEPAYTLNSSWGIYPYVLEMAQNTIFGFTVREFLSGATE